jgi:hypothetical protein
MASEALLFGGGIAVGLGLALFWLKVEAERAASWASWLEDYYAD